MGILSAILTVWLLPLSAAGQSHPRILVMQMEAQTRFSLYFVAELEDALFGRVHISREPNGEELERAMKTENLVQEVNTNRFGYAEVNFSELSLVDGVYLVAGEGITPFYVCIPAPEGDNWAYTVEVFPGYLVGGEAEPVPTSGRMISLSPEQPAAETGELGGIFLVMAGGWAFLRRILRPECW